MSGGAGGVPVPARRALRLGKPNRRSHALRMFGPRLSRIAASVVLRQRIADEPRFAAHRGYGGYRPTRPGPKPASHQDE